MKAILQILLILVISLGVVGATYGVSQTDWAMRQSFGRRPPNEERTRVDTNQSANGGEAGAQAALAGERRQRDRHNHHDQALSLASLGTFVRILLPMALVIGGVGLVRRRGVKG